MVRKDRLTIKVSEADKQAIRRVATAEGETVAVVVRRLIREAARELDAKKSNGGSDGKADENKLN